MDMDELLTRKLTEFQVYYQREKERNPDCYFVFKANLIKCN